MDGYGGCRSQDTPTPMRLKAHLQQLGMTGAEARRALENGKVFVSGIPSSYGGRDVDPAEVEVRPEAPRLTPGRDLIIVHRDPRLVVVWKPAGLLSVPARKEGGHRNVVGLVRRLTGAGLAVHRLDQPTSGLMMVARDDAAQRALKSQLEVHSVERRYLALVQGIPRTPQWRMESHLVVDRGDGRRGSTPQPTPESKRAVTDFRLVETYADRFALVEAQLETGRTHQVRIHLSEHRNPVLGDPVYAKAATTRAAPRLALHAAALGFEHPDTQQRLRFEAPLPDDLMQLTQQLVRPDQRRPPRKRRRR